jgi:hypothetical protein
VLKDQPEELVASPNGLDTARADTTKNGSTISTSQLVRLDVSPRNPFVCWPAWGLDSVGRVFSQSRSETRVLLHIPRHGRACRFTPDFSRRDKHGVMRRRGATRLRRPET